MGVVLSFWHAPSSMQRKGPDIFLCTEHSAHSGRATKVDPDGGSGNGSESTTAGRMPMVFVRTYRPDTTHQKGCAHWAAVVTAAAGVHWERARWADAGAVLETAADFGSTRPAWRANVAHALSMQGAPLHANFLHARSSALDPDMAENGLTCHQGGWAGAAWIRRNSSWH